MRTTRAPALEPSSSASAAGKCASGCSAAPSGRFADKHNWARRGVLIAHAGFVIVAAGTTLYWARGFSGELAVLTGQTVQVDRNASDGPPRQFLVTASRRS